MSSRHGVRLQRPAGGYQERPSPDRSHARRSPMSAFLALPRPPQPVHQLKTRPAAAATSENGRPRSCSSRVFWDDVLNQSKEGQAWTFLLDMASIHASEPTLAVMKAALPHVVLCFIHITQYVVFAALRRGHLPQLQELHPDAGDLDAGPLCPRRLIRRHGGKQGMAATIFGRMCLALHHGPVRQKQSMAYWLASTACPQRCQLQTSRPRGRGPETCVQVFFRRTKPIVSLRFSAIKR